MARDEVQLTPEEQLIVGQLEGLDNNTVIYKDNAGVYQDVALGVAGTVLQSNGATSAPSFASVGAGDVIGPATNTDSYIPQWDGVNSKTLKNGIPTSTFAPALGADDNYVTNAEKIVIGNTSGTNSGNETTTTMGTLINGATEKTTPVDADMVGLMDSASSNILKKLSWSNIKATLKTYFDSLTTTLTNKTINLTNNTLSGTKAEFDTAVSDGNFVYTDTNKPTESMIIAVSDETTAITTGTAKITFRMPYAFTLTTVRASLSTASSSGTPTIDINEGGTTILSTKITIDANEKTSTTAATQPVISDSSLADDAEITIDIDTAGTGAKGLKIYLIGNRT